MGFNFLEELVAQWYEFKGFFIRRNIQFGVGTQGGREGEIDLLAFNPSTKEAIHIETAVPSLSYKEFGESHRKKFEGAEKYYKELLNPNINPNSVKKISIVHTSSIPRKDSIKTFESIAGSKLIHLSVLLDEIITELEKQDPKSHIIEESYSLLRMSQILIHHPKKS